MRLSAKTDSVPVAGMSLPRIPPGTYEAVCHAVEAGRSWGGRENVYVRFRIHEGDYDGTELFMVCTFHRKSELTPRHKYYEQWTLANDAPPRKGEKLHFGVFKNRLFEILVRDTQKRHRGGKLMADCVQYSVVDSIVERIA